MFRHKVVVLGVVVLALVLAACAADSTSEEAPPVQVPPGHGIGGYVELVDALRAAGATVESAGTVEQPFFSVAGQIIRVDGVDVQVFEYVDETAREAESEQISLDGTSVGTSMITWVAPPHFWARGRVIVLYVGTDAATLDLLETALTEPSV